jgi:hypothetical protein
MFSKSQLDPRPRRRQLLAKAAIAASRLSA